MEYTRQYKNPTVKSVVVWLADGTTKRGVGFQLEDKGSGWLYLELESGTVLLYPPHVVSFVEITRK